MKRSSSGFTLVEILVTIALIGATAIGINTLFVAVRNIQQQTFHTDIATRAAQRQIEVLRNDNYALLDSGQLNFTSDLPAALPQASGIVTISEPTEDLRRVDVTVNYTSTGKNRSVTLSSLIGVIGITR